MNPQTRTTTRPDLRAYFKARIDWHTKGLLSTTSARLPREVQRVIGDVTDERIAAIMEDGTAWTWTGGRFSQRKQHGTYPPLMPVPEAGPLPVEEV